MDVFSGYRAVERGKLEDELRGLFKKEWIGASLTTYFSLIEDVLAWYYVAPTASASP